jgi:hypothetical protein
MFEAEAEVKKLQEEIVKLHSEIHLLQRQQSSRKGDPGPKGDSVVGPAGRDAVLRVVTDAKENVVHVFDENGTDKATIVAVPGPIGVSGQSIVGPVGASGKDGRNAPSLSEVVQGVLAELKARWTK